MSHYNVSIAVMKIIVKRQIFIYDSIFETLTNLFDARNQQQHLERDLANIRHLRTLKPRSLRVLLLSIYKLDIKSLHCYAIAILS
jgi:hypothetical protein